MVDDRIDPKIIVRGLLRFLTLALLLVGGCLGISPHYTVYQQRMEGEAMLAKAEYSKKVLVQDALARMESAKSLAEAAVTQAKGVAEANRIIGASLENNPRYLEYLWIHNLESGDHDVIYVPTEAGIPILEAGGRRYGPSNKHKPAGSPGTAEHPDATSEHRDEK